MPRLTKTEIEKLKPSEKDQFFWDTDVSGFGLRVAKGGKKTFVMKYRVGSGRGAPTRRMTIGPYGSPWTPDMARKRAIEISAEAALGGDPAKVKQEQMAMPTLAALCDDYMENGVGHKKASTLATDRGRIARHIKPLLGNIRIDRLTVAQVRKFYEDLAKGKTANTIKTKKFGLARVTGGEGTARRTVGLLGGIMAFAIEREWIADNVVHRVKRRPDRKVERYLTYEEVERLVLAIDEADYAGANYKGIAIIRLLFLTGARKGEIEQLKWKEVDFDNRLLRLGDSKTGASVRPLGPSAAKVLKAVPKHVKSPYVFPADRSKAFFLGTPKIWAEVRKLAGLEDVRLHDLRHSVASIAISSGASLAMVGNLLGHKDLQSTQRYAHLHDKPMQDLAAEVGAKIKIGN